MKCSNTKCPFNSNPGLIHGDCFDKLETKTALAIKRVGATRTREWSKDKCYEYVWQNVGYELIMKLLPCACQHGFLRKHEEVQEVKMSKVGDKKKSALPKLNEHRQLLSQKAVGKIYKDQHSYQNPRHDKASTNNNIPGLHTVTKREKKNVKALKASEVAGSGSSAKQSRSRETPEQPRPILLTNFFQFLDDDDAEEAKESADEAEESAAEPLGDLDISESKTKIDIVTSLASSALEESMKANHVDDPMLVNIGGSDEYRIVHQDQLVTVEEESSVDQPASTNDDLEEDDDEKCDHEVASMIVEILSDVVTPINNNNSSNNNISANNSINNNSNNISTQTDHKDITDAEVRRVLEIFYELKYSLKMDQMKLMEKLARSQQLADERIRKIDSEIEEVLGKNQMLNEDLLMYLL